MVHLPIESRLLAGLLIVLALSACTEPEEPAAYSSRGVVRQLGTEIYIAHEAIPDFRDARGNVVGMEAMAMPFVLATPELADGISPGSKITFDFLVRWRSSPALQVIAIEKLPDETPIAFGPVSETQETDP